MRIRRATSADFAELWPILKPVFRAGETYAIDRDITKAQAEQYWCKSPLATYVAEDDAGPLGTYYLRPNQAGGGAHVCNCGYIVAPEARGQGVAAAMCRHSQSEALAAGFRAMQFNLVLESNAGAVRLWQSLGFKIIGTIPEAFAHPSLGFVDAHVMHKRLDPDTI